MAGTSALRSASATISVRFQEAIDADTTGSMRLVFSEDYRSKIHVEFENLYLNPSQWDSETSTFFLERLIDEFTKRITAAKTIIAEINSLNEQKLLADDQHRNFKKHLEDYRDQFSFELRKYQLSLLERKLFLGQDDGEEKLSETEKTFRNDYLNLLKQDRASQLSLDEIFNITTRWHWEVGMNYSAAQGLAIFISKEIVARINQNKLTLDQHQIATLGSFFAQCHNPTSTYVPQHAFNVALQSQITAKAQAFMQIYHALREGQSGIFKTNFVARHPQLEHDKLINVIEDYVRRNPKSRTARAWELTQLYYDNCSSSNLDLVTAIYKWSFKQSGYVFKCSNVTGTTFFKSSSLNMHLITLQQQDVERAMRNPKCRTAKICRALSPSGKKH